MGVVVVLLVGHIEVLERVAKTAAARKAVRAVGEIAEEAVSLAPHLGGEVGIVLVNEIVSSVGEQGHGLDREGQDGMVPLLVEPIHEMFLEPVQGLPLRGGAVREAEIAEHSLEVCLVEVADVPEDGLVTAVPRRHVHGVHDLLEIIVDHLGQGALLGV